mmetsp:Transcript_41337/g.95754  ORF Transcript_41337/g.95754 Transcript_41337/m.95754 type:complete len:80 (+) Transcript_41337:1904-2143(+)
MTPQAATTTDWKVLRPRSDAIAAVRQRMVGPQVCKLRGEYVKLDHQSRHRQCVQRRLPQHSCKHMFLRLPPIGWPKGGH